jgi:DNA mismatch repair protein MutS
MKQYNSIKAKYPDALLLFRVGDFYETFGNDAIKAAKILGIVQTKRGNGSEAETALAGFPHHSLNTYLPKLVRAGLRVAICDQLEDPKLTKKIVKRGVTEVVTPGVALNDDVLDAKSNNFLASVYFSKKKIGIAFVDISTGEFLVSEGDREYIDKLLQNFKPSEVLFSYEQKKLFEENFGTDYYTFKQDEWIYQPDYTDELLNKHFETVSMKGFGVADLKIALIAAGAILHYLSDVKQNELKHINKISRIEEDAYVWMDRFTIRNLELYGSTQPGASTLLDVIDKTITPMGGRTLKRWLALPLKDKHKIDERLQIVAELVKNNELNGQISSQLKQVGDMERLVSKIATGKVNPREIIQLQNSLEALVPIKNILSKQPTEILQKIAEQINSLDLLRSKIKETINEDAPVNVLKGNVIKEGVSMELDELRQIKTSSKTLLDKIVMREIQNTGINSLKIGFNNVFGYYLEVRNTYKDRVPEEWIRKQTLTSAERYITEELKELESKILGAEDKIQQLEQDLFARLVTWLHTYIEPIQHNAQLTGQIDTFLSYAKIAVLYNYTQPQIDMSYDIEIKAGRHPVIERQLPEGESYVPNDIFLDREQQQIMMITGPNMSGKSALLRQTALIVLLAQIGSFVPAKNARIGIIDKIFTRVGASDNISMGESTFMVEMNETASILNNLSERSLILLDEIGRGTSTYDGISIAWAIAEYLHEHPARPKTLFATHYHELNEMSHTFERIKNYNVSIKEVNNNIIFVRKLVPGGSEHSFGIHVAKIAGMPLRVINKANKILKELEASKQKEKNKEQIKQSTQGMQLSFFQLDDPLLEEIKEEILDTDIDNLTPVEALMKLNEIKRMLTRGKKKKKR